MLNFNLWKHHGLSLEVIENMFPFERDVYVLLLRQWLDEEKRRADQEKLRNG